MAEERSIRKTFSRIGLALCALIIVRDGAGILMSLLHSWLLKRPAAGAGAAVLAVMESGWFQIAGRSVAGYILTIPLFLWMLRKLPGGLPGDIMVKKKLRVRKLLSLFVISMGLGYLFNLAGVVINLIIAAAKGGDFSTLNPISNVMQQMTISSAVYVALIAPVVEEFLFRGIIVGKTKKYGEQTAILFSAILFGLLHGNIAQTLYATFIGLVLGYIAVKTGGIVYSCIVHMMINGYSTLIAFGVKNITSYTATAIFSFLITAAAFALFIMAVIFLCLNWKKTSYEKGETLENVGGGRMAALACWNPGVLLFTCLCLGMMAYYIFVS